MDAERAGHEVLPRVSVIVPCRQVDEWTKHCVRALSSLSYPSLEIIVLPDSVPDPPPELTGGAAVEWSSLHPPSAGSSPTKNIRVVVAPTGPVSPGKKRNIGASLATGSVLAYIDSDAYPRDDWLSNAIKHLMEYPVVGGPAITPPEDPPAARVQDAILSSPLASGKLSLRHTAASRPVEVDDLPSVNMVADRRAVEAAGGWDERYWPGEDTLLALRLKRAGYRMAFCPDVVVYHHRRPTIRSFLRQVYNYGVHRGFFAKRFPETSRRLTYFVPSAFLAWLLLGAVLSLAFHPFAWVYVASLVAYFGLAIGAARKQPKLALWIIATVPAYHAAYGSGFIRGLFSRELMR